MMNGIRKVLLAWQMRRRIVAATKAIYSEQLDVDTIMKNMPGSDTSTNLLRTYIAIRVAADTKSPREARMDDVLEETHSSELLLRDSDTCRTILELRKSQAEVSLLKAKIQFSVEQLAPEFSYQGMVYRAERNKKGPLSFDEREKLRAMSDELAEVERRIETLRELPDDNAG
jgi:hypothetical protein